MKLIILSDSHGDREAIRTVIDRHQADADGFAFLGDGLEEFQDITAPLTDKKILGVCGNNDFSMRSRGFREQLEISLEGHRLLLVHGHRYSVKRDLLPLAMEARQAGADIALYGHTHAAAQIKRNGIFFFNPGSLRYPWNGIPSYGILELTTDTIQSCIVPL